MNTPIAPSVILVDEHDGDLGDMPKLEAHQRGALHRAVSVFAFDADKQLLIQRRAPGKYHSGGLWSNSACTHPRRGESLEDAARRCMREELGLECESIKRCESFVYRAQVSPALEEHELDHVFLARVSGNPAPNASEVQAWRFVALPAVRDEVARNTAHFTAWFALALDVLLASPAAAELQRAANA